MSEPVEERGGHFGVTEDAGPFSECEVGSDDDRGAFVELADQMEPQLAAGLGKVQVAQFIQNQEVEPGDQVCGPALPLCAGFSIELVDEIDHIEGPAPIRTRLRWWSRKPPPDPNAVCLLTIHAAKGFEFENVWLVGVAESILPSWQSLKSGSSPAELEEERRNFFVAITRTRRCLTPTYASRYRGWYRQPSRFIKEMNLCHAGHFKKTPVNTIH